jgi:hypothetical protein
MYAVAQPTTFPASAGVGGNNSNSYYGDQAGLVNTGTNNTFIGASSGLNCTTGVSNTFLGSFAGGAFTIGANNTFVGNNSGGGSTEGTNNTFVGGSSGFNNYGDLNVFVGSFAGSNNIGNDNLFMGANSGYFNSSGNQNTFLGSGSGRENEIGSGNVFVGYQAGEINDSDNNSFVGYQSGLSNTEGSLNSFFGYLSGFSNTTGNSNTFFGEQSGLNNVTGSENTFIGSGSGFGNTIGSNNSFFGDYSGGQNSTGNNNTYIGNSAGSTNINGSNNVFLGANAGEFELGSNRLYISNSSVSNPMVWGNFSDALLHFNAAVGIGLDPNAGVLPTADFDLAGTARLRSLVENETLTRILVSDSDGNIAWKDEGSLSTISDNLGNHQVEQNLIPTSDGTFDLGASGSSFGSLYLTESVLLDNSVIIHNNNNNIAFGINALSSITTGTQNVAVGQNTAAITSTGSNNVSLGWNSLSFNTTGSSNTAIGFSSGPTFSLNTVNSTSIGNQARASSNAVRLGNASVTSIGGHAAWTNLSDGRFKDVENTPTPGLEYVMALRPVSYTLKREALHQHLREEGSLTTTDNQRHFGFIAQEVLDLDKKLSLGSAIVDVPETEQGVYGIRYDELTAIYAKSIQELLAMVNEQKQEIAELKALFSEILNTPVSNQIIPKAESSELDNISFGDINPNPFDNSATIEVIMPRQIPNTMVVITDLQGGVVKEYPIQRTGETKITVSKADLKGSGIYLYSLVAGGSVIKTKRMIIR